MSWVEALGVWAAVVVALFWESVRNFFVRPQLVARRASPEQSVQRTSAYTPPSSFDAPRVTVPCYYCHLEVANEGRRAARNVEVFLRAVHRREGDGWALEERFIPQWLVWTTMRNLASDKKAPTLALYLTTLPPKSRRYLDLAHVFRPQDRPAFLDQGQDDPEAPREQTLLSLDVAVTYLRAGHLLRPGHYQLTFEVAAENAEPERFEIEVTHTGEWRDNEEEMRAHGIRIGEVRPARARRGKAFSRGGG